MSTSSRRRFRRLALVLAAAAPVACRPRELAVIGPVADPQTTARALGDDTGVEDPLRIVFGWELNDAGQRVEGRGVARIEPPYKARLDLFLDNGETVISAALVDGDLRLPPGSPDDILPPPDLMWGALGIFRPVGDAQLVGADRLEGDAVRLRYRHDDGREVRYQVEEGVLTALELLQGGRVVQRVDVAPERIERYPVEATYRHLGEFRELKLVRESISVVEAFDPEIWDPAE
jgi:hypothetical protein